MNAGAAGHDSNGMPVTAGNNAIGHNAIADVSGEAVRVSPNYRGANLTGLTPAGSAVCNNGGWDSAAGTRAPGARCPVRAGIRARVRA